MTNLFNITSNANNELDTLTNFQKTFCRNDNTKNNFSENSTASGKNSFSKKIKKFLKSDLNRYDDKFSSLTNRNSNMKKKIISMSNDDMNIRNGLACQRIECLKLRAAFLAGIV